MYNIKKRGNKNEKKNIVMILCVMLVVLLVGCGKEEVSELPTSEVESGVISEEVSEPVSEEVVSEEVAIIPNGAKYTLEENEYDIYSLRIMSTAKDISEFKTNVNYISFEESPLVDNIWIMYIETVGTDLEVSFTVNYEDGTSEDFTIYVTTVE